MRLEGSSASALQEVDQTHQAARVSMRPLDAARGHYRIGSRSGAVTGAGVVAGAPLFSVRWADPSALMVLLMLEAYWINTTAFTAAQELGLDAIKVTGFTGADSAGTAVPITGNKARTSMQASGIADIRIAAATLLTAGTRTLDGNAFAAGGGLVNVVNAAAGTAYLVPGGGLPPFGFQYRPNMAAGEYPIVLSDDEGILVRNTVAFPAAGVATLVVNMSWAEVEEF